MSTPASILIVLSCILALSTAFTPLTTGSHGPSQCPKGDMFCQLSTGNEASYCKYWQSGPGGSVCQGSDTPCQCAGCKGDPYCHAQVGPSSYCKYWQKGAGKVCQYSTVPCDCKGDEPAPAPSPASSTVMCLESTCPAEFASCKTTDAGMAVLSCLASSCNSTSCAATCVAPYEDKREVLAMASCGGQKQCWHMETMSLAAAHHTTVKAVKSVSIHKESGSHCNELWVAGMSAGCMQDYWGAHGYQFEDYQEGLCPEQYNVERSHNTIGKCTEAQAVARLKGMAAALVMPMVEGTQTCAALGGICTGSAVNTTGSCCAGSFCKYWQQPEGRVCQGCYNCKCGSGGPGATDDPSKCIGDNGKQCPYVSEC